MWQDLTSSTEAVLRFGELGAAAVALLVELIIDNALFCRRIFWTKQSCKFRRVCATATAVPVFSCLFASPPILTGDGYIHALIKTISTPLEVRASKVTCFCTRRKSWASALLAAISRATVDRPLLHSHWITKQIVDYTYCILSAYYHKFMHSILWSLANERMHPNS